MNRVIFCVALGSLQLSVASHSALAADRPRLERGQAMSEVLARWGQPTERIEQESRRREVWVYPSGEVIFKQGVVIATPSSGVVSNESKPFGAVSQTSSERGAPLQIEPPTQSDQETPKETVSSADIIGDVLRALPAGEADKPGGRNLGAPPGVRSNRAGRLTPNTPQQLDEMMEDSP